MDQIVNLVSQRTGINQDQARTAVDTVLGYLKDRVPGPIAGQLDKVASGEDQSQSQAGNLKDKIPGL